MYWHAFEVCCHYHADEADPQRPVRDINPPAVRLTPPRDPLKPVQDAEFHAPHTILNISAPYPRPPTTTSTHKAA